MTPALRALYSEPHRRYHTLAHIEDCLAKLEATPDVSAEDRRVLELAIWWHDAIYDPRAADNEERSAELAVTDLAELGEPPAVIDEVARLILLTKGHETAPGDRLGAAMIGIDLSILGAQPDAYDRYAAAVREEYAHVPDAAFRAGRAGVLRRFLATAPIFADPRCRQLYETQARNNLAREIAALEA